MVERLLYTQNVNGSKPLLLKTRDSLDLIG